jgi:hypothetical protein
MGSLVAYPVDNPVFRGGSTIIDGNFVTTAACCNSPAADRFPSNFTPTSIDDSVIRTDSVPTPTTTRGGVA